MTCKQQPSTSAAQQPGLVGKLDKAFMDIRQESTPPLAATTVLSNNSANSWTWPLPAQPAAAPPTNAVHVVLKSLNPKPTNAVHVVLKSTWQVHVNDMADALDVQPSAGNVSCNQHPHCPIAEVFERLLTFVLQQAAQPTGGSPSAVQQLLCTAVDTDTQHQTLERAQPYCMPKPVGWLST
jgi:hypothetical protein